MKAFKLDENGDLIIENGDLVMVKGNQELVQSIDRILTTNINEWFLDLDFGLDYNAIRGKGKDKEGIKLAITEAIYQDERIKSVDIKNITISKDRYLKVYGTATDLDGNEIQLGEVVDIG